MAREVESAACERVSRLAEAVARGDGVFAKRSDLEAEDVAQDVVTAYLRLADEPASWKAWTRTATRHRLIDVARQRVDDLEQELSHRARHHGGPSAGVIADFQVREVLGVLTPKHRALLVDHLSGWSAAELAEAYGYASSAAASQTVSRVLKKLRAAFAEMAYDLAPQRLY